MKNEPETFEKYIHNKIINNDTFDSMELEKCVYFFDVRREERKGECGSTEVWGTFEIMGKLYSLMWYEHSIDGFGFEHPYFEEISD